MRLSFIGSSRSSWYKEETPQAQEREASQSGGAPLLINFILDLGFLEEEL